MEKLEKNTRIFIVEDDDWYREYLSYTLSLDPENEVQSFASGKEFMKKLDEHPDIVTVDYSLPDTTGSKVLEDIKKKFPTTEVIVISEQDKIDTALELLKSGAYDYFVKSKDIRDRLLNTVNHIKSSLVLKNRLHKLEKEVKNKFDFRKNIIGSSSQMQKVFDMIGKAVNNNLTVTITGETGTGKEEVAKAIHYNSSFNKGPFVAINIAAVPRELAESELFGHEKGSFTGATATRIGKFEEAKDGTIFLDEIGDMDLSLQVKLLRVLQEKNLTRVGGNQLIKVNSRVIVATHKNLLDEVKAGRFREDLYYRIFGLTITLPPLRERGQDIILLALHFIENFCRENKIRPKTLSQEAREKLLSYSFPGNVRELKSFAELACVMASADVIEASDIPINNNPVNGNFFDQELSLDDFNRKIIRHYLDKYDQNVVTVAQKLSIGKSTIYRMLKDDKGIKQV